MIWFISILVLLIDQLSKHYVLTRLGNDASIVLIPHLLEIILVENTRGAYGLFGDHPVFLIAIATIAFLAIWLAYRDLARSSRLLAVALGLVLGGAFGNILDRLHQGFVVDFIRVDPLPIFEVFNIADTAICCGIVAIIGLSITQPKETRSS